MMIGYLLLIFILAIFYFLLLRKYGALWDKIQDIEKNPLSRKPNTSVSILIPFRNESHALPRLIQSLNQLDINDISVEVVFINDHSSDSSCDLLSLCELAYSIHHLDEKIGRASCRERV